MVRQFLIALSAVALTLASQGIGLALDCQKVPEQTTNDWAGEVNFAIAKIGPVSGVEAGGKLKKDAKDLLEKLPDAGKIYMELRMLTMYCSSLRDNTAMPESEKSKELKKYIEDIRAAIWPKQPAVVPPAVNQPGTKKPRSSASDSARETLTRLGMGWTSDSFADAIVRGDLRRVSLFLDGGMTPELNHKGTSMALYALQPAAANRSEVLKLFLTRGMDPNKNPIDTRIMPRYGRLPPPF
ncbi:MAG: hypothetical protein ABI980_07285 [Nitrospirota bacterium]